MIGCADLGGNGLGGSWLERSWLELSCSYPVGKDHDRSLWERLSDLNSQLQSADLLGVLRS